MVLIISMGTFAACSMRGEKISIGLCQGMLPLIAYNYASKRLKRMNGVVNVSRYAGIAIAAVSIFLYEMFSGGVIRISISTSGGNTMETVETVAQGILMGNRDEIIGDCRPG